MCSCACGDLRGAQAFFCSCSSRHALRKFHQRQEGLQSHKAFHLSSLYFSLIAFIRLSDILSRLYSEKKKVTAKKCPLETSLKKQTNKKNSCCTSSILPRLTSGCRNISLSFLCQKETFPFSLIKAVSRIVPPWQ